MTAEADLSHIEKCFLINAFEHDILAGVFGDLSDAEQDLPLPELAKILQVLIDSGWIEVRRYAPWIVEGEPDGLIASDVVPQGDIPSVLADPANWKYPEDGDWVGAITLVETDAGRKILRRRPDEQTTA